MQPYYQKLPDGSILIEWVSPDARFFINIETNPEESGWGYVTKEICACGKLPPELQRLLTIRAADGAFTSAQILKVLDVSKGQRKRSLKKTPRR